MNRVNVSSAEIDSLHVPDLDSLWLGTVARFAIWAGLRLLVSCRGSFVASKGMIFLVRHDGVGAKASELLISPKRIHAPTSEMQTLRPLTLNMLGRGMVE